MKTTAEVTCPKCGQPSMDGHGGNFGGRITSWKKKCSNCDFVLLIVPMDKKFEYTISAETTEEIEKRIKKRQELRDLEEKAERLRNELRIN